MLHVSDETKSAYMSDSTPKTITITFPDANVVLTNEDLVLESVELMESIEENATLQFFGCISSQLSFKVAHIVHDLRGEYLEASISIEDTDPIPLFSGYVERQTNRTQEDIVTEFVCFDVLKKIRDTDVKGWYNNLTFPITVKNARDSLFTFLNITQETVMLPNDSETFTKEDIDTLYAGDAMKAICQANARPGQIGRDGKFYYRKLDVITEGLYPSTTTYPSETTYPSDENAGATLDPQYYKKIKYEPFFVETISKVTIVNIDSTTTSYGNGTNELVIQNNFIARNFVDKQSAMQNIYAAVQNLSFTPMNLECKGMPYMECGDIILSYTKKNVVRSYILNRVLRGIQALMDSYKSDSKQFRDSYVESAAQKAAANYSQGVNNAANITRISTLVAQKANISDLNATNARINNLAAIAITTQNLSAQTISANQINGGTINGNNVSVINLNANNIKAGTLSVNRIDVDGIVSALSARSLNASSLSTNSIQIPMTPGSASARKYTLWIDSATMTVKAR